MRSSSGSVWTMSYSSDLTNEQRTLLESMFRVTSERGVEVRVVDRFLPSSKTCSGCGEVKGHLSLSDRRYSCDARGLEIDRDLNAAVNLPQWIPTENQSVRQAS